MCGMCVETSIFVPAALSRSTISSNSVNISSSSSCLPICQHQVVHHFHLGHKHQGLSSDVALACAGHVQPHAGAATSVFCSRYTFRLSPGQLGPPRMQSTTVSSCFRTIQLSTVANSAIPLCYVELGRFDKCDMISCKVVSEIVQAAI
jgi:hypothetical protein